MNKQPKIFFRNINSSSEWLTAKQSSKLYFFPSIIQIAGQYTTDF